ncbi:MAG: hypothetical protein ACN6PO_12980, partial [Stenotrophomonas bentonitica]
MHCAKPNPAKADACNSLSRDRGAENSPSRLALARDTPTIGDSLHQIAGVIPMAEIKEALVPDIGDY